MTDIKIERINSEFGAYVTVATDSILEDGVPAQILDALSEYSVLVFPQINLSDDAFVLLTNRMGSMEAIRRANEAGTSHNEKGIYHITLDKDDKTQREFIHGNNYWHMDGTAYDTPGKATLLKCEQPSSKGGDTGFASLFTAYEALPQERKQQLSGLRARHCMAAVGRKLYAKPTAADYERWDKVFPPTEHKLVWKQQDGRTSLVIGSTANAIVGMEPAEGTALLQELVDWCTQEQFTYRHKWQKGDMVIFNNPGMLHRSFPYTQASGRVMHRTTIKGYEAFS